jgi:hypothetical protein
MANRSENSSAAALRRCCCVLAVTALMLASGCKKQEAAPPPEPAPKAQGVSIDGGAEAAPAPVPAAAPTAEAGEPAAEPVNVTEAELLEKVQYAYFTYCREHTAPPRDFSVLVAEKYLPALPVAPPGKKFVIDNKNFKVLLVNQ